MRQRERCRSDGLGNGGIRSNVSQGFWLCERGSQCCVADGTQPDVLLRILRRAEPTGTVFECRDANTTTEVTRSVETMDICADTST